uniref:Uncharacterized protein n=1 Tax=Tanacetum cinerariifolium TaxID=118510 RepID=A0A6L2NGQ2_TANCI|nr:hypothetical protein [Tanacetum cinerariifolium]
MAEEMRSINFGIYWAESVRQIFDKGDLSGYWRGISFEGDFLCVAPSYTLIRNPLLRLCYRLINSSIAGRSQAPENVTLTDLFYLMSMDVGSLNIPYLTGTSATPEVVPAIRTMPQRRVRHEEEVHMVQESLDEHYKVIDTMARDFSRFIVWAARGISQLLDATCATYTRYFETRMPYQRLRVRRRNDDTSTLAVLLDEHQPDP